jgi:putative DNA primase/helicase
VNWHRQADGWRAQKPDDYQPVPYSSNAIDPFDPELIADEILWPEGEKDVDSLNSINLPAFTFGGADGLPEGIGQYLRDRRLVILADNDDPGRAHAEKKAALAHDAGAASIKIVHFPELLPKGDVLRFPCERRNG